MGNENSSLVGDDVEPQTLTSRTLPAVADLIRSGGARQIVAMTGAGLSTAAGIPDFRSPKTGLYHNLARLNLPHAEAVFEIDYFRQNPDPFYVLARELYPGKFRPTVAHVFLGLLARKGLLRMLFTQNIDCLERAGGVPGDRIVEAHGSFATQRCIDCKEPFPDREMREHVEAGTVPRCQDKSCGGLVKPDIVFFGEQLPEAFFSNRAVPATADLVLVLGTSLSVQPFASLPLMAREGVPRVLFNLDRVGDLGTRSDDVLVIGDCDDGVRKLADELGWREQLEEMWRATVGAEEAERQVEKAKTRTRETELEDEVDELADNVEGVLKLGDKDSKDESQAAPEVEANEEKSSEEEIKPSLEKTDSAPSKNDTSGPAGLAIGGSSSTEAARESVASSNREVLSDPKLERRKDESKAIVDTPQKAEPSSEGAEKPLL